MQRNNVEMSSVWSYLANGLHRFRSYIFSNLSICTTTYVHIFLETITYVICIYISMTTKQSDAQPININLCSKVWFKSFWGWICIIFYKNKTSRVSNIELIDIKKVDQLFQYFYQKIKFTIMKLIFERIQHFASDQLN